MSRPTKPPALAVPAAAVGVVLLGSVIWRNWDSIVDAVTDESGNVFSSFGDLPWWAHTLLGFALVAQVTYRSGKPIALICKGLLGFAIGLCIALMVKASWEWDSIIIIATLLAAYAVNIKHLLAGKFAPTVPENGHQGK